MGNCWHLIGASRDRHHCVLAGLLGCADAVAVDEEDAAVRGERAENFRRPEPAGHAIERDRGVARLIELHALLDADIERIPVDDRAVARLIDDHLRAALTLDRRRATDDGAALGPARSRRRASAMSAAVVSTRLLKRGCIATVPLQPSAQDEEEPRIFPWALLEQAGQGGCADQALALRDLRHG
jgi:hypothetical protein